MLLLLDSSGPLLVAALAQDAALIASCTVPGNSEGGRDIRAVVEGLLPPQRSLRELSAIGVGIGPGSFIGTRAAVSFANGLAVAGGLPVHPIPTLAAYTATQQQSADLTTGPLAVLRDARRAEAYLHIAGDPPDAAELLPLDVLAARLAERDCRGAIAELPLEGDKRADEWQTAVGLACSGRELRWEAHVPAEGLLAILPHCGPRDFAEPIYLRGFL